MCHYGTCDAPELKWSAHRPDPAAASGREGDDEGDRGGRRRRWRRHGRLPPSSRSCTTSSSISTGRRSTRCASIACLRIVRRCSSRPTTTACQRWISSSKTSAGGVAREISLEFSRRVESSGGPVLSELPYFRRGMVFLANRGPRSSATGTTSRSRFRRSEGEERGRHDPTRTAGRSPRSSTRATGTRTRRARRTSRSPSGRSPARRISKAAGRTLEPGGNVPGCGGPFVSGEDGCRYP